MQPNQAEIFAGSECDRWFAHNRSALEKIDLQSDFPLKVMELYRLRPRRALEIGASNGFRMAALAERYGCESVAVELSAEAVHDGKAKFPDVKFVCAPAHEIPLSDTFDLVIVNGVYCVVDRTQLLRCVAEADRLLADGGYLLFGDFLPANLLRVRYHHLTDQQVYTYKQDYASIFVASGLYHPVCLLTADFHSRDLEADAPENDRFCVWLLRKMLHDHYAESALRR